MLLLTHELSSRMSLSYKWTNEYENPAFIPLAYDDGGFGLELAEPIDWVNRPGPSRVSSCSSSNPLLVQISGRVC